MEISLNSDSDPMKRSSLVLIAACAAVVAVRPSALAENWAHWRGPAFNGSSPEKQLPTEFSLTEGLTWSIDLPGPSAATPVVWGDRVFVSTTDDKTQSLLALCVDRGTGKILWNQRVSAGFAQDNRSNYSAPSPVTDGERVIFFFGNGELVAFDLSGKRLWQRNLQKDEGAFGFLWTFSTSPTLHNGVLYMQVLQRDTPVDRSKPLDGSAGGKPVDSYLLAVNPETGRNLWKHVRPSEAKVESREAFTTPIPFNGAGRDELLVAGGDCLTGHDPKTGKELWRWGTWNESRISHWRLVPSPVAGGGVILACAPKKEPVFAVKAGLNGDHEGDASALTWTSGDKSDVSTDVPTPAFAEGDFFVLSDVRKMMCRVAAADGSIKWSVELPGFKKWRASPTVADGKVYLMNHGGEVMVLAAKDGKVLHTTNMGEERADNIRSSVVVSEGQLFFRTHQHLHCVGQHRKVVAKRP